MRIYLMAGEQESTEMIPDMDAMRTELYNVGFTAPEIVFATHWDGTHSEWYWRREFPYVYQWLFGDVAVSAQDDPRTNEVTANIFPNPFSGSTTIRLNGNIAKESTLILTDVQGRPIASRPITRAKGKTGSNSLTNNSITINSRETGQGFFLVHLENEYGQRQFLGKLAVQ